MVGPMLERSGQGAYADLARKVADTTPRELRVEGWVAGRP